MTAPPLNPAQHCCAAMPGRPEVLCGRHRGHGDDPGDLGHRQRGADGGTRWPSRTPPLATIESLSLDLSSALLTARNAAPVGTPAHAALTALERASLELYDAITRLRVEAHIRELDEEAGFTGPLSLVDTPELHRCAGSRCPGYPYPASVQPHPASCVGAGPLGEGLTIEFEVPR